MKLPLSTDTKGKEAMNKNLTRNRIQMQNRSKEETDEEVFSRNEVVDHARNGRVKANLKKRTKSQWEELFENMDINTSCNSGLFKLTLHQMARDGEAQALSDLLKNVPDQKRKRMLNKAMEDDGGTPLHLAARHNHYEVCKLLIKYGANVDSLGEGHATPLHYAARYKIKKKFPRQISKHVDNRSVISLLADNGAHVNITDVEGQTPLHAASIKGNMQAIIELLRCPSIDIKCTDNQGMTALHMAATHGYVQIVKMLIDKGADLHSCDNDLMTPLHFACSEGNTDIVQMILEKGKEDGGIATVKNMLEKPDASKGTCLHMSVGKGHKKMVIQLLDWAKLAGDVNSFVNMPAAHRNTALHIAASQGHCSIAETLINDGAKVDARNDSLATALLLAAQYNYFKIVELLRQHDAQMEIRDKDSMTPLLVASKNGNLATISWLIENGADVTATDKDDKSCLMLAVEVKKTQAVQSLLTYSSVRCLLSETDKNTNSVLHIAAKKGHVPLIKILVDNGARIDFKNEDERTPVHVAALYGQHSALWELLDHDKTMINSLDENANTALHLAATEGHTRCVQILLDHGANVELRNTRQWSALDCACAKGRDSTVLELLQAQSPVNPPKLSKTTPLHQACLHGHLHVVNLLLEWKADLGARTIDGRNPLDCAIDKEHRCCVQAILQHHNWKNAMRNAYMDKLSGLITTPVRKLIVKMPDMAELAFSRCITNNGKPLDDVNFEVTLDYEFLDDMYTVMEWNRSAASHQPQSDKKQPKGIFNPESALWKSINFKEVVIPLLPEMDYIAFNDFGKPSHHAMAYTNDTSVLRYNHPLHIMANRKRERLLQHPVVTGLLQYKWRKYGGLVYYSSLFFLLLFVLFLNVYLLAVTPPYAIDFLKSLANRRYVKDFEKEYLVSYTKPDECYSVLTSGTEYRGYVNKSASGAACVPWQTTNVNSHLFPKAGLDKNYCRNPETLMKKPWCYTRNNSFNSNLTMKECDIPLCPVYVKGEMVPLGQTCHFPFKYGGRNISKCLPHETKGKWCSYTYDFDKDQKAGKCTKENTLCNVDSEYHVPCGPFGIDRFNCEARGCCFALVDTEAHGKKGSCFKKLDPCSDRSSYCAINKSNGMCETARETMMIKCSKTCGFCNVTEEEEEHHDDDKEHQFLHLISNYPNRTFDPNWEEGCYYVVPDEEKKWGEGCHFKKYWEDPIRFVLVVFSSVNLLLLIIQIWNYKYDALSPIFFLEGLLFILCLLLILNFRDFDVKFSRQMILEETLFQNILKEFQYETGLRQHWQWQCGAIALFLSWMDLLLYIRKIPYLGIYVVMFNDVLRTFVKFSIVFLLFILSFALTFHTLLQNGVQFGDPFRSILMTSVMMVGDLDFGSTFYSKFTTYPFIVHYQTVTFLIFSLFIVVMMIIIMNLLVGLAVGDIMEVKEHATLERLKMQVDLALEVEFSVPYFLRKRFVRKHEFLRPNKYRKSNALVKALFEDQNLSSKNIVSAMNRNKSETEEIHENVTFLNHVIIGLCNKTNDVDSMVRDMVNEVRELKCKMESYPRASASSSRGEKRSKNGSSRSFSSSDDHIDDIHNCFATCEEVKKVANSVLTKL